MVYLDSKDEDDESWFKPFVEWTDNDNEFDIPEPFFNPMWEKMEEIYEKFSNLLYWPSTYSHEETRL